MILFYQIFKVIRQIFFVKIHTVIFPLSVISELHERLVSLVKRIKILRLILVSVVIIICLLQQTFCVSLIVFIVSGKRRYMTH